MQPATQSQDERQEAFSLFLQKYIKRGYRIVAQTATTAELYRPARFPSFFFPEKTLYVDVGTDGWIYVHHG